MSQEIENNFEERKKDWDLTGLLDDVIRRYIYQLTNDELNEINLEKASGMPDEEIKNGIKLPLATMQQRRETWGSQSKLDVQDPMIFILQSTVEKLSVGDKIPLSDADSFLIHQESGVLNYELHYLMNGTPQEYNASKEQQAAYDVGEIEGEKLSYFKKGYTFDITQTNFPPEKYPKLLDRGIPSEFHRSCTNILKEYCEENLGLKVFLQDQEQNIKGVSLYGYHSPSEHEIHIASTLQDTAAFSTLTHEFGHALAHGSVEESLNTNLHQKEFEADVMSIMFCQHYGLEITDERKSHLSGHYKDWKKSDPNNFHPDKSMRKMFDLFREHSTVLDQKIVKAFPELATKLLPQELEVNSEKKKVVNKTAKRKPKKKKTPRL